MADRMTSSGQQHGRWTGRVRHDDSQRRTGRSCSALAGRSRAGSGWAWPTAGSPRRSQHGRLQHAAVAVIVPSGVEATADFLAPLPVQLLASVAGLDDDFVQLLQRLGIRQLGQLAALSIADVLARFGRQGEFAHRIASGGDDRPPDTVEPPSGLVAMQVLDDPAHHVDTLVFIARQLADELTSALSADGKVCTRLIITAETDHSERNERLWYRSTGLSAAAMVERARWQLDAWVNSAALQAGVTMLRLEPVEVRSDDGVQLGLWGGRTQADEWAARAVARLATLAGAEHVLVPAAIGWPAARRRLRLGTGGHRRSRRTCPAPYPTRGAVAGQPAQPVTSGGVCRAVGDRRARQRGTAGAGHRQGSGQRRPGHRATRHRQQTDAIGARRGVGRAMAAGGTLVGCHQGAAIGKVPAVDGVGIVAAGLPRAPAVVAARRLPLSDHASVTGSHEPFTQPDQLPQPFDRATFGDVDEAHDQRRDPCIDQAHRPLVVIGHRAGVRRRGRIVRRPPASVAIVRSPRSPRRGRGRSRRSTGERRRSRSTSRPTSSQCRASTATFFATTSGSPNRLQPSAYRAASRSVRRSPEPPTTIGMCSWIGRG